MKPLVILLFAALACRADLNDAALREIKFDQKPGAQVPMDLRFTDETGKTTTLADSAAGRPVLLMLGYYKCPMLCTLGLNGLVAALQDMKPQAADIASVLFVSIDPSEVPALASAKKATYMKLYARKEAEGQWHFLIGSARSIQKLADAVGFRYVFDPASQQFAHPSGLIILTPDGRISRYFFGLDYPAKPLDDALKQAAVERTGGVVEQFVYLCFHYSPIRGKYGASVLKAVRAGGVLTLVVLAGTIFFGLRRGKEAA